MLEIASHVRFSIRGAVKMVPSAPSAICALLMRSADGKRRSRRCSVKSEGREGKCACEWHCVIRACNYNQEITWYLTRGIKLFTLAQRKVKHMPLAQIATSRLAFL